MIQEFKLKADQVEGVDVHLPEQGARVVNNRSMPDINCQYIMAVIMIDGALTFKAAHSFERMSDPRVLEMQGRVNLIGDPRFAGQEEKRPSLVRVHLKDSRTLEKLVTAVRGTADNPMTRGEIEVKSRDLLEDVLGMERTNSLISTVWNLEQVRSMRDLRPMLTA